MQMSTIIRRFGVEEAHLWSTILIGVVCGRVSGWDGKGFLQYIQFEANFGNHIWFWQDCWCDDEYDSSTNREASVDSLLLR